MRISEKIVIEGEFWLPSDTKNKIPGKLIISDGGEIELEITGFFGQGIDGLNDTVDISRIQGETEKGLVTLDNCFYFNRKISFPSYGSKSRVCANMAIFGVAYKASETIAFNTFSFSVEGLEEWLCMRPITVDVNNLRTKALIKYSKPKDMLFCSFNRMKIQLTFAANLPVFPIDKAEIKHNAYIKLVSKEERPLSDFMKVAGQLNSFFCFAIDKIVCIKNVTATSRNVLIEIGKKRKKIPFSMEIFYQSQIFSPTEPKINMHNMLFQFKNVENNSSNIIKNWLEMYKVAGPALDLYFSQKTGAYRYLQAKFLVLAQGLEVYHRKIYANRLQLRERLRELFAQFESFYNKSDEIDDIATDILGVRNYLTHYDKDEFKGKTQDASTLYFLYTKMESTLQLHILKYIGFTDEEIKVITQNNHQLKQKLDMKNTS